MCVLNLKNIGSYFSKNTSAVKWLCGVGLIILSGSFNTLKHPFYMGVTDLKYDAASKNMNVSVKLFTNDLEEALRKNSKKDIDILHPKNKAEVDSILFTYIKKRLSITLNFKPQALHYIGYEREDESVWTYLELKKVPIPKTLDIDTKLLYDDFPQQINIVHAEVNGIKKSSKVTNPDSKVEFSF